MKTLLLSSLLIIMLFTTNIVWAADESTNKSTLGVEVLDGSIYSHKASDGTTVAFGEIQNNLNSPVNAVTIGITFMDGNFNQIEYKTGTTLLQVIQPGGKAPFMISSTKPDLSITQIQVKIAGFQSSSEKQQALDIVPNTLQVSDKLLVSGTMTNNGPLKSVNTKIYLISYDAFQRIVAIGISDPINVDSGKDSQFSITSDSSTREKSYMLIAESDNYQSKLIPVNSVQVTLPIAVSNTVITDPNGTAYSTIPVNASAKITSNAQYVVNSTQSFIYYVQVKQFSGQVEFIGKYEGAFLGPGDQSVSVNWTPRSAGSYFIETYVWNYDAVPLSSAAPSINLVLVK